MAFNSQAIIQDVRAEFERLLEFVTGEQALTIDEAMYAHTMGGAYADFAENVKGSLEPGKFADLVVWRDNPYTVAEPADLLELTVDLTMVGGKTVYERPL
ncbi:MAG: amidohydrolase family protein [Chloroflexota bacterium]